MTDTYLAELEAQKATCEQEADKHMVRSFPRDLWRAKAQAYSDAIERYKQHREEA